MKTNDSQSDSRKRPASHKWALACFVGIAGVNIMLNANGHFDTLGVLAAVTSLAGIISFLFFPRSPRSYTVGIVALGFVLLRAGQSTFLRVQEQLHGAGAGWLALILMGWILFLLILLFRAYTLGAPSRQYYGFPTTPNPRNG
jgi:hypothetical protein